MRAHPTSETDTYTVHVAPAEIDGGFVAEVLELPGCMAQGDTLNETLANMEDALRVLLAADGRRVVVGTIEPTELPTAPVFDLPVRVVS